MDIVIGGYYQGKKEVAKTLFNLCDGDILKIDIPKKMSTDKQEKREQSENLLKEILENLSYKKCIYQIENLIKLFIFLDKSESDINDILDEIDVRKKIIIATDISQGIVPMDKSDRLWREWTGRMMIKLCKDADSVHRVFCGMSTRIK